jgi:small subunit ribosomal protein S17e
MSIEDCSYAIKRRTLKHYYTEEKDLGKVKTDQVKRTGKELMRKFPATFTINFDENKRLVSTLTQGATTRVRNQIAGYITRTIHLAQVNNEMEPDMEEEAETE